MHALANATDITINLAITGLLIFFVYDLVVSYATATGSTGQRFWTAGKQSATVIWLRFVGIVAAGIGSLEWIADALNAPQVSGAIATYGNPKVISAIILGITVVGEMSRRRRKSLEPTL